MKLVDSDLLLALSRNYTARLQQAYLVHSYCILAFTPLKH